MASQSLLEYALQYAARGWAIIPLHSIRPDGTCTCKAGAKCRTPAKHPRVRTGKAFAGASTDPTQLTAWWTKWPEANIGVATGQRSGFCLVDIDGHEGVATLRAAITSALPRTLQSRSGRIGIGRHALYAIAGSVPTNSGQGLDIRGDNGLAVLPPSRHISGQRYAWIEPQVPMAPMPVELLAWFAARPGGAKGKKEGEAPQQGLELLGPLPAWAAAGVGQVDLVDLADTLEELPVIEDVAAACALIANNDRGWDDWNRIVMAIWRSTGGSEAGLQIAHFVSRKSKKYDADDLEERWRHYADSPPTDVGFGTLVHEARLVAGESWTPPSRAPREASPPCPPAAGDGEHGPEEMQESFNPFDPAPHVGEPIKKANGHHVADAMPELDESFKKAETPNNPLIRLNERYCVIGDVGGKCLVLSWVASKVEPKLKVPSFQSFKSFAERYANKYVSVKVTDKKGNVEDEAKQLGAYWLKWPHRRSYEGIDLSPENDLPEGYLNLWSGFAVSPACGGWSLMREHVVNVLAAGDPAAAGYILRFAAWAVQHPGERAEVALVFKGGKGSGKGTFANALVRIFGQHGLQIFNPKHLVGAFNGHLRNCLLLFADEAFWAGDKQGESVLKGMLTERTLVIEHKGVDAVAWRNRLHVIMAANADWVVPASHDERRFAMFDASNARIGDRAYFEALHKELNTGGLEAMLFDLQRAKLGEWHPRMVIQNEALRGQKERSLGPIASWWVTLLEDAMLPPNVVGEEISATVLLGAVKEHSARPGDVNATALGRFLRERLVTKIHKKTGEFWKMPTLAECRHNWEIEFSGWKWATEAREWRKRE